jgi:catechol 2,3-dioxygenase
MNARSAATTVTGLAEIVLNVRDVERSLAFYRDLLGLQAISGPERKTPVCLRAGDASEGLPAMVVLVQLPGDAGEFTKPRVLHHLALSVPNASFDAAVTELQSRGYAVRFGQHPVVPSKTMYLNDPDGNEVELIAPAD